MRDSNRSPVVKGTTVKVEAVRLVLDGYAWEVIWLRFPHRHQERHPGVPGYAADECRRVREMVV